jgi:imidazolonepropionase-like amidohydrolase
MKLATTLLLALAFALPAVAQDLLPKAAPQSKAVLLTNATLHPISGPTIAPGWILYDKGRIVDLGDGEPPAAKDALRINLHEAHVYPGLIGSSTGLGLAEHGAVRATRDAEEVGAVKPEVRAAVAVNPDSTLFPVARLNGVLVAATLPTGGAIPGRVSVIRLDGWTWESMAIDDAAALLVSWPRSRPIRAWWMDQSDEEQMNQATKRRLALTGAFVAAKAYRDARLADASTPVDLRWEAMLPYLSTDGKPGKPVFFEANDLDQIVGAVNFAIEEGLRPVIVGGRDARGCLELLKRHDVAIIVTGTVGMPKRDDSPFDDPFTLPRDLQKAGIRWCLATGERLGNERNLPYDAARAVAFGLDRDAGLRSITLSAAEILGIGAQFGSLEKGKSATLIVTTGDPLEITTRVIWACIDGREITLQSKQTALAKKYREKYEQLDAEKK